MDVRCGGSAPRASAGSMSVPRSTARIWMTVSGSGTPNRHEGQVGDQFGDVGGQDIGEELADIREHRPPLLDRGHDAGEVVVEQDHVGGLARHVGPAPPMAMPMSARFSAGASFTPSPVTATISPLPLQGLNDPHLLVGADAGEEDFLGVEGELELRYPTCPRVGRRSRPRGSGPRTRPISRAMASAVWGWSPVIMMTRMPAACALAMAARTSGRGGSSSPTRPARSGHVRGRRSIGLRAPRQSQHAQAPVRHILLRLEHGVAPGFVQGNQFRAIGVAGAQRQDRLYRTLGIRSHALQASCAGWRGACAQCRTAPRRPADKAVQARRVRPAPPP